MRRDGGSEGEPLAGGEVGEAGPFRVERAGEDALQDAEEEEGGDEQAEDRDRCGPGDERERAFEDEEFAEEAVEAGQAERREEGDAHESGEDGRDFAQAAEVVEAAQAAGAFFEQRDEPEEGCGGEAVVEHLQEDAVHGGVFFCW